MESRPTPNPSRLQFTLRRAMIAVFWLAICLGGVVLLQDGELGEIAGTIAVFVIYISPFIAVASLLGRPIYGLIIGLAVMQCVGFLLMIAVYFGWAPP